jgi:hypothetical protein
MYHQKAGCIMHKFNDRFYRQGRLRILIGPRIAFVYSRARRFDSNDKHYEY